MHHIVYLSSAIVKFTEEELKVLLLQAREKNSALQLTGMLLYIEGNFIQVLEGDKEKVMQLFTTISLDPRHNGILKIFEKPLDERNFSDWTMGFKSLTMDEASQLAGYRNLKNDIFKFENFKNTEHPAVKLLKTFYRNNTRP